MDTNTKTTVPGIPAINVKENDEFNGELLTSTDAGFDRARSVWNAMIDKRPALIARCKTAADIRHAVMLARRKQLVVSVRGGGHNVAGNAVCDRGLMIDLSAMKAIEVDPVSRIATAEPGVVWKEFDNATLQYNLATPGGTVSDTGIAGLTLGGGQGWLSGKHGLTCDNLLGAEIVTANGEILKTDKDHHPDLFWAIRGGGGNFGIVSQFKFQLHPVHPTLLGGMILYPMDQAREVMRFYKDYVRKAPDELMSYSGFIVAPDGVPVTLVLPVWTGAPEDAEKQLAPLRSFGSPVADLVTEMTYPQLQSILDGAAPAGIRRYWKSGYFLELPDELIDIYLEYITSQPSPMSAVLFFHLRGAAARVDRQATAFPHRNDEWDTDIISQWVDAGEDEKNISWTRAFWKAVEPFTKGVYVNHLDYDDGNDRVRTAYGSNYKKLQEIKAKYDPENFFKLNNNIIPAKI